MDTEESNPEAMSQHPSPQSEKEAAMKEEEKKPDAAAAPPSESAQPNSDPGKEDETKRVEVRYSLAVLEAERDELLKRCAGTTDVTAQADVDQAQSAFSAAGLAIAAVFLCFAGRDAAKAAIDKAWVTMSTALAPISAALRNSASGRLLYRSCVGSRPWVTFRNVDARLIGAGFALSGDLLVAARSQATSAEASETAVADARKAVRQAQKSYRTARTAVRKSLQRLRVSIKHAGISPVAAAPVSPPAVTSGTAGETGAVEP